MPSDSGQVARELVLDDDGLDPSVHLFDPRELSALDAALAARRPLLVRGEPGTGKSQLARAAARLKDRALVYQAVDRRTEVRDLLYGLDAVARLANAMVGGAAFAGDLGPPAAVTSYRDPRELMNFVSPGALWWAFDWKSADQQRQRGSSGSVHLGRADAAQNGVVVLIDEIDKADPAVPDALLDALGHRGFSLPDGSRVPSSAPNTTPPPLIVLTTNEARALSPAFERRCLVLRLEYPSEGGDPSLGEYLVRRGQAHVSHWRDGPRPDPAALERAAGLLIEARKRRRQDPRPGLSEYLDLLRAVWCDPNRAGAAPSERAWQACADLTVGKYDGRP